MTQDNRFASILDVALWDEVWAYARGWWRPARVVTTGRRLVTVAFRLVGLNVRDEGLRSQQLPLRRLRRTRPSSQHVLDNRAPTEAEIRAAMSTEAPR